MEDGILPSLNLVPCVRWIRKGIAKGEPDKIELTKEELVDLVKTTNKKLSLEKNYDDDAEEGNSNENIPNNSVEDEYDMANYDKDEDPKLNIDDIAVYDDDDPYKINEDEPDSDAEDDIIKPDDNLIVVGHDEGYGSALEVYVYNHSENSLYVHHDILIGSTPLCIEWLNYDPKDINRAANLCAVGNMTPIIEVWDIDLVNCIRPSYVLGKKPSRVRGHREAVGHKDAVIDMSWNTKLTHILASGSADKTILLWDLEHQLPHTKVSSFEERVQTLEWHPVDVKILLAGSSDRTVKVFDFEAPDAFKSWTLEGEAERVLWNRYNPNQFFCSDGSGFLYCFDCRQENSLWKVPAHTKEVTGLTLSSQCPGFLATASQDGNYKVWDITGSEPELIAEKNLKIGEIQCLESAPDDPFLMASGGDKKNKNLLIFNAIDDSAVQARFGTRELIPPVEIEGTNPTNTSEVARVHPVMKRDKKAGENSLKVLKKRKIFKKLK